MSPPWLYLVSKLLALGCPSQMHHLGQIPSVRTLRTWEKNLASKMSPPWDFAPWLYLVSRLLANGYPSQIYHLGQLSHPRLLEHERKSPASKMTHPWDFAPWLHLVSKLLGNWCPSQMLTPGQILSSYILKPLRKDPASIMNFIPSLLIFGGCLASDLQNPASGLHSSSCHLLEVIHRLGINVWTLIKILTSKDK